MEFAMRMPDLGTVDDTIKVVKWLAEVGQPIRRGQKLVEVETDKSIMELESTVTGTLQAITVAAGSEAAAGEVIATFAVDGAIAARARIACSRRKRWPIRSSTFQNRAVQKPLNLREAARACSLFERNREARAEARPASTSSAYPREFLLDLYRRMVLIREFEEGVKFLFLEGAMPGTIHQCQGQEATAVGVCAALEARRLHHLHVSGPWPRPGQGPDAGRAALRAVRRQHRLLPRQGGVDACGQHGQGNGAGHRHRGGRHPARRGHGAGVQDAEKPERSSPASSAMARSPRGRFTRGSTSRPSGTCPCCLSARTTFTAPRPVSTSSCGTRGSPTAVRPTASGAKLSTATTFWPFTRRPARRPGDCRRGQGPVLLELLTYRRTGHSRRDACHYQPKDEREDWFARDPIERLGDTCVDRGLAGPADLDNIRTEFRRGFQAAVEVARRQPLPSAEDLTTDVFA